MLQPATLPLSFNARLFGRWRGQERHPGPLLYVEVDLLRVSKKKVKAVQDSDDLKRVLVAPSGTVDDLVIKSSPGP